VTVTKCRDPGEWVRAGPFNILYANFFDSVEGRTREGAEKGEGMASKVLMSFHEGFIS